MIANTVLCASILVASGWLGLNLITTQDMTMPFVMAAMMIVLGLGVGYVISRTED